MFVSKCEVILAVSKEAFAACYVGLNIVINLNPWKFILTNTIILCRILVIIFKMLSNL